MGRHYKLAQKVSMLRSVNNGIAKEMTLVMNPDETLVNKAADRAIKSFILEEADTESMTDLGIAGLMNGFAEGVVNGSQIKGGADIRYFSDFYEMKAQFFTFLNTSYLNRDINKDISAK